MRYNKPISITGFSYITGISFNTIEKYSGNNKYIKTRYYKDLNSNSDTVLTENELENYKKIYPDSELVEVPNYIQLGLKQKLLSASEEVLTDLALDGSVMALAVGKIKHGWIEGGLQQKQAELLDNFTSPAELLDNYKPQAIAEK